MIKGNEMRPRDLSIMCDQLTELTLADLKPLPAPFDKPEMEPGIKMGKPEWAEKYNAHLDGFIAIDTFERPKTKEEEDELVQKFLSGVEKMLSVETNAGILQALNLSMEYCAKCNTCSNACHIFEATGGHELYRPTFRAEVLRMIVKKYFDKNGKLIPGGKKGVMVKFIGGDIELNWQTVARLGESAYRCNLCRRCAQTCPLALDNGLLAREIRKIFSQELGYAPKPLHEKGTVLQLKTGSSTGMSKVPFLDTVEFLDEDATDLFGEGVTEYKTPMDVEGADILLLHNAGEFNAWPENPMAFTMLFQEAGLSWTLSSEICGYDNVNYGLWYDDAQAKKVAIKQNEVAQKLG
ncbi:MAG: (Fe-S)-binding protein, partial [Peptococcaceae bacterium]|nr:(Fe-S)-binding protein [Peptococcaceae bacterium]